MTHAPLAIPLFGKLATRSYHSPQLSDVFARHGLTPKYFVGSKTFRASNLDPNTYFELRTDKYESFEDGHLLLKILKDVRRFIVRTETTDLRLRERIESLLFDKSPLSRLWGYAMMLDFLRRIPKLDEFSVWCEKEFFKTQLHSDVLTHQNIKAVLTPGMGGYGFYNECLFAREAQALGIKTFASITNYDNIVNMGFRGYLPECVGVWNKSMASDVLKLQKVPADRIEVTGPVQFDRYFKPLSISRNDFLQKRGLDPAKQTILYAGGVNITRYFELYKLFASPKHSRYRGRFNLVIRAYPHGKLLDSPGWFFLEEQFLQCPNVYISNSLSNSADSLDSREDDFDELHCLLKFSDVMINLFSTISLESALCDLPTIHLGYDESVFGLRYPLLTAFQQRQTHNIRPLRLAASSVVQNEADLIKAMERYLANKAHEKQARLDYAVSEVGELDGKASHRLVEMIVNRI